MYIVGNNVPLKCCHHLPSFWPVKSNRYLDHLSQILNYPKLMLKAIVIMLSPTPIPSCSGAFSLGQLGNHHCYKALCCSSSRDRTCPSEASKHPRCPFGQCLLRRRRRSVRRGEVSGKKSTVSRIGNSSTTLLQYFF